MITATKNNIRLDYPEEVGFCFNPCLIALSGDNLLSMVVSITDREKTLSVEFDAFSKGIGCDVREFVQSLFNTSYTELVDYSVECESSPLGKSVQMHVDAYVLDERQKSKAAEFDFSVFYVWGALSIGEAYNKSRTLTCWRGFPFSVSMYSRGDGAVLLSNDGVPSRTIEIDGEGVYDVVLPTLTAQKYFTLSDMSGTISQATFDKTFGLTFQNSTGATDERVHVNISDDADEGVYLRWINRHGFVCYWLFKQGSQQYQVSNGGEFLRDNMQNYDISFGYQGAAGRRQMYTRQDILPVCAPLVDEDTWAFLLDVTTSPIVDMFCGYNADNEPIWRSVTIQPASYTKAARTPLQDFAITLILGEIQTQKL